MRRILFGLCLLACSENVSGPSPTASASNAPAPGNTTLAVAGEPMAALRVAESDEDDELPDTKFTDGAKAFAKVRQTLLEQYYAEGIGEDELYRAATAGMLEKIEPRMSKWNKLISAQELAELKVDLSGEIVGIGVKIKFDQASGYADVIECVPGSPSARAGLTSGDKIVTVNGRLYKGMKLRDVVYDIRGKAGESVTLTVLRGAKLETVNVLREKLGFDIAEHAMLDGGLAFLHIPSFNEKTPAAVKAALEDMKGAKALVVDLRHDPGGSFESAVQTVSMLLPEGSTVVTLKRKGKADERELAKGPNYFQGIPVAVLVDGQTASGSEFFAATLQENRQARIIGAKTTGKWSVQMLDELGNGYAFKYTVSLFRTPSGKNFEGVGMAPDIEVTMDESAYSKATSTKPSDRLAVDVQLRTAKEVLLRK